MEVEGEAPPVTRAAGLGAAHVASSPSATLAVWRLQAPTRCMLVAGRGGLGLRCCSCWEHKGGRQALRGACADTCPGHASVVHPFLWMLSLQRGGACPPEAINLHSAERSQAVARLPAQHCTGPGRVAQTRGGAAAARLPQADAAQRVCQLLLCASCAGRSGNRRG